MIPLARGYWMARWMCAGRSVAVLRELTAAEAKQPETERSR